MTVTSPARSKKEEKEMKSETSFKLLDPRTWGEASEGLKLLAGVALTCWVPPLMYCSVTGQSLPFYAMLADEAIGVALGLLLYRVKDDRILSCVPADSRRGDRRRSYRRETKIAA
jgi:hypothetical protein